MTKVEREELISIIEDVRRSDDQICVLNRLYDTVKRMVGID